MQFTAKFPRIKPDAIIILSILLLALAVRIPLAANRTVLPAGDAFNYQKITENILRFQYPLNEKRLPGFPFLLIISRIIPIDHIDAAVGISLLAGAGSLAVLYQTGRELSVPRAALIGILGLAIFDPLLSMASVRPLADSTFVFWMTLTVLLVTKLLKKKDEINSNKIITLSIVTSLMMFTRYEGFIIAAFLFPLLKSRLTWRQMKTAAIVPVISTIIWIPIHIHVHGSIIGGYADELTSQQNTFGGLAAVPSKVQKLTEAAGWGKLWTLPSYELEQPKQEKALIRILQTQQWWLALLGVLGVIQLIVRQKISGLPIVVAGMGYILVLMWWLVYGRFVAPLAIIFYFTAAVGAGFLYTTYVKTKWANQLIVTAFIAWLIVNMAPGLHKTAMGRIWESNGTEFALYSAFKEAGTYSQPVAFSTGERQFISLYLQKPGGFYFATYPDHTPSKLVEIMQENNVRHIIESQANDPRLKDVLSILQSKHSLTQTKFVTTLWSNWTPETTIIHHIEYAK